MHLYSSRGTCSLGGACAKKRDNTVYQNLRTSFMCAIITCTGYQRELTYRHTDGSYSAFGNSDESGSTWLTAFVVRCFAQAREFIYIDDKDLQTSIEWFRNIQKENGCFRQVSSRKIMTLPVDATIIHF